MSAGPVEPRTPSSLRVLATWLALVLLVGNAFDLLWKFLHWSQYSAGVKLWQIAIALAFRFFFMLLLLLVFLTGRANLAASADGVK